MACQRILRIKRINKSDFEITIITQDDRYNKKNASPRLKYHKAGPNSLRSDRLYGIGSASLGKADR
jgi:hypothetical protein